MGRKFIFTPPKSQRAKRKPAESSPASPEPQKPPEPPSEQTDVEKATEAANDALTERLEQSPTVQKAIADEREQNTPVGYKYIEIGSADKNEEDTNWQYNERQAPQAYQIAIDIANAAAIAQAAEEARQEVIKRYREEEKAKSVSTDASGQAELQREREKMREEDRRRADLRKQEHRGASLWPGVDEQHARRMQTAFENRSAEHPSPFRAVLGFLRKWTAFGGVFFLGATWTMIQIDEYALAAVLLLIGMFAFSVQIYDWKGIDNHRNATQILKGVASLLIVGSLVFFGAVIIKKKGTKLWSNLLPERIAPVTPEPSINPFPPPVTLIRHSGSFFFATYPQPFMYQLGDDSLVPIALDLAITITNNRGTTTRITSYTAEIQTRDGAWHRLRSLPMSPPRAILFLNRSDIRRGMICDLDPPAFDALADRREIGIGETIEGQMFFELPPELRYETVSYGKLKVSMTNIQGEPSEAIFDNPPTASPTGLGQINGGFTWCPGKPNQAIDLSKKIIRPLGE